MRRVNVAQRVADTGMKRRRRDSFVVTSFATHGLNSRFILFHGRQTPGQRLGFIRCAGSTKLIQVVT